MKEPTVHENLLFFFNLVSIKNGRDPSSYWFFVNFPLLNEDRLPKKNFMFYNILDKTTVVTQQSPFRMEMLKNQKKKIKKNLSYSHYKTGIIYFPVVIRDYNLEWSRDVRRHITNHYE